MKFSIKHRGTILFLTSISFIAILFVRHLYGINNNTNYAKLGNRYFLEHKYDEALKAYEKAIELGYKTLDVFYNLGYIYYYEKRNFNKAKEIFKKGVRLYPSSGTLHDTLSQLYFDINNFSDAVKEYKLAVGYSRDLIIVINAPKARELLRGQKKSDKEINDFFQGIVNFNPNDYFALYEIAGYNMRNKNYKEALKELERVLELSPNQIYVYRDIADCYYNLGEVALAKEYSEKAKALGY